MKAVIKTLLFSCILALPLSMVQAQKWVDMLNDPTGYNFYEIQKEANQYFEENGTERGSGYKQYKRWEEYMEPRVFPDGELRNPNAKTWKEYRNYLAERPTVQNSSNKIESVNGDWTFFGSEDHIKGSAGYNGGIGRVNVIAQHPTNSNIIYAGTPAGGLWKTTNGGSTWNPLTDGLACWGVSGIAIDPGNTNTVYILTGDGDGSHTRSAGVMKTTDGGSTWNNTGLFWDITTISKKGYKLAMDPNNSSVLYAIMTDGVYKTTNAGTSWNNIKTGSYRDFEFKPGSSSTLYLVSTSTIYRSNNAGSTWTTVQTISGSNRIALAVTPANSNYVYALCGKSSGFNGIYRSTNSGVSFTLRSNTPNIMGYSSSGNDTRSQSWYDLACAVSPTNAEEVYSGGINVWKSTNGGTSWSISSYWIEGSAGFGYTHADIHELVAYGGAIYCGSDGGVYKTTNGGSNWTDISSGLAISQFYRFGGTPQNNNLYIGGTQDNGTNIIEGPIPDLVMEHVFGADGMEAAIDPTNSNTMYMMYQGGALQRSFNKGSSWSYIKPNNLGGANWVSPYVLKPGQPTHILVGFSDIGLSTNQGSSFTNLTNGAVGGGACNMVCYAPSNTNYIYAAKSSAVYKSTDGGSTWTNITSGLPGGSYTYITTSTTDPNRVYVTRSGYSSNSKVFMSTNGGSSWTNISGSNLPNIPANCIIYEDGSNNGVYVGMDCGVYYLDDDQSDWIDFSNGLPNIIVKELEINYSAGQLRAATFGRSLWESDLYSNTGGCPDDLVLSGPVSGTQVIEVNNTITSTHAVATASDITYSAGLSITLNGGFDVPLGAAFNATLDGCSTNKTKVAAPINGHFEFVETDEELPWAVSALAGFELTSYPNPFQEATTLSFKLPEAAEVQITVFDVNGKEVAVLVNGHQESGLHQVRFDASSLAGSLYFVRFSAGAHQTVHKLVAAK